VMTTTQAIRIAALVAACAGGAWANPSVYEPFGYPAGALGGATNGGEIGLDGAWIASVDTHVVADGLGYGALPTAGGSIGDLSGGQNRFGGARTVSASALAGNGLLDDGAELWFSVIMGYDIGGNLTNSRLAFALANNQFNGGNYRYYINDEGTQLGSGLGVTLARFSGANGKIVATQFQDASQGTLGSAGNVFGSESAAILGAGQSALVVGKIDWGAASDSLEIYVPDEYLDLGSPISTLNVSVDQATFDTITFARGDKVVMDEVRFGASYEDVVQPPDSLALQVNTVSGEVTLMGGDEKAVDFNYYQITSDAGSLDPAAWHSLADQDFDGNGPPSGTGDGWEEGGASNSRGLAEAYLLGDSTIALGASVGLGAAYDQAVDAQDLVFRYRIGTGQSFYGPVEYFSPLLGDVDGDGDVDNQDIGITTGNFTGAGGSTAMTWVDGDMDGDGDVDNVDIGMVTGAFTGAIGMAETAVPEPATGALLMVGGAALLGRQRWRVGRG
jgi:hypothetical protein